MPQTVPMRVFEEAAASTSAVELSLPSSPQDEADPRLEPVMTGWLDDDMRRIKENLSACEARQLHFARVVATRQRRHRGKKAG